MFKEVVLNEYGFYMLKEIPSTEEREAYYKNQYYQQGKGAYQARYTDDELCFLTAKLEQKLLIIRRRLDDPSYPRAHHSASFLDIGCGEGFALSFFKKKGFVVLGLDYSDAGLRSHNADVLGDVTLGDIFDSIQLLVRESSLFDVINIDNLLEHVDDPRRLLEQAALLLKKNGVLIIKVPNDFSALQQYFISSGIADQPYWVVRPDHISYFNSEGLIRLCEASGFECVDLLGDQLIEFSAMNPNTNFIRDKSVGKACHFARVAQENFLHGISPEKTLAMYRVFGEMGLGREIICVLRLNHK